MMTDSPESKDACATTGLNSCCGCGPWWRLPLLLALVLAAILLIRGRYTGETEPAGELALGEPTDRAVSLTIDFGDDNVVQVDEIPWRDGMTVHQSLLLAGSRAGGVTVLHQGSGETAFLTRINDVANEGAGGRNWLYTVNGQRGDRSFAIYELEPGDHVLWTFGPRE